MSTASIERSATTALIQVHAGSGMFVACQRSARLASAGDRRKLGPGGMTDRVDMVAPPGAVPDQTEPHALPFPVTTAIETTMSENRETWATAIATVSRSKETADGNSQKGHRS